MSEHPPLNEHEQRLFDEQHQQLITEHGAVPPPYFMYPDRHPVDIFWRMGHGERYRYFYSDWLRKENMSQEEAIEYFRKFPPPPLWLTWMADCIWSIAEKIEQEDEDQEKDEFSLDPYEFDYWIYFRRMAALGFGAEVDCKRAWDEANAALEEELQRTQG